MLGERLRLYRLAKGFSMDDLVEATRGAISKQALSKYENGKMNPSPSKLVLLAKALGVKAARFLGEPQIHVELVAYRKKSRLKEKEKDRLKGLMQLRMEIAMKIQAFLRAEDGQELGFSSYRLSSVEEAEEIAVDLRNCWGLGMAPIPNLLDTLEHNHINVLLAEGDGDMRFDGLSAWVKDETGQSVAAVIAVRNDDSWARQRMNLAHELGHLVQSPQGELDEEKAAFRFAGAFLAPKALVLSDFGKRERPIRTEEMLLLKKRYGLSVQAIVRRLYDLGLVSSSAYRSANIELSRAGFKKKEPFDDEIRPEASLVSELRAIRALKDGIISQDEYDLFIGVKGAGHAVPGTEPGEPPQKALRPEETEELNRFFRSEESKEWEETDLAL